MQQTFKTMVALTVGAAAMCLTSCNEDEVTGGVPTQQEIESNIIGKWKAAEKEGQEYLTNNRVVMTFDEKHQSTSSYSRKVPSGGYFWGNRVVNPYQTDGNRLTSMTNDMPDYKKQTLVISAIDKDSFTFDESIITLKNDTEISEKGNHVFRRVTADYSRDILGVWEGVSMTGDETYGSAEARIAYYDDNTYTYYRKIADVWYPSKDEACEYNVDGDWLATRWMPEEAEDYNYEWWDIDAIKDGTMKWSALRERKDGSRYNTTFTWKKVDDFLTPEQIMAKLPGTWVFNHVTQTAFINGEIVSTNSQDLKPNVTYTYTADGKLIDRSYYPEDHSLESTTWHSYTIKGNLITSIIENYVEDGVEYDILNGITETLVVHSITDDYLTIMDFIQMDEYDEDFGGDALLMIVRMKRIE